MFGSEIIDVVIGMIFVFLTLSLVCSAVNEIIEAWLNKRADYLEKGIKELLTDKDGNGYVKELYKHPLVAGLFRGDYGKEKTGWRKHIPDWLITVLRELGLKKTLLPSYIPAQNFALALMDIALNPSTVTSPPAPVSSPPGVITSPPSVSNNAAGNSKDMTLKALRVLNDAAGGNPAKAKENIENWYNSSMDRVSGWYKRRTQVIILLLGLAVTIALNADSIAITNSLSTDKALRNSLVSAAQEYAKVDAASTTNAKPECTDESNLAKCKLDAGMARIKGLGLPIGWGKNNPILVPPYSDGRAWLLKILGWLITAFAISLGAPFWFDLLNKFMVVRATVKPKEKSPDEPSKP